ncbi:hypothetical protein [Myxococcus sp. CA039A]|uniref:hypothetical protein n=1 Tax=Myxococcus sp. CA039A TaxID=2741737 RepID=UPI00157A8B93|nr:hypothetical protein [Myxococcus sp. CA039A]NTX58519.1 hypothetical protein [Myxococcus sp. CA039A]
MDMGNGMKDNAERRFGRPAALWLGLFPWVSCGQPTGAPGAQVSTGAALSGAQAQARIAAGDSHSLALRSDGTAWGWGYNAFGEVGDGITSKRSTPVPVPGLIGI